MPELGDYAGKYPLIRQLLGVPGNHDVRHAWRRDAREALQQLDVERGDAYEIAELLTREQIQALGEIYDAAMGTPQAERPEKVTQERLEQARKQQAKAFEAYMDSMMPRKPSLPARVIGSLWRRRGPND